MGHTYTGTSYNEPGLSSLLGSKEKRELAIEARKAFKVLDSAGAIDETFDEFRHRIAIAACGRRISEAVRGDYGHLMAAFAAISGNTRKAYGAAMRGETEGKRIAMVKLEQLLRDKGNSIEYARPLFLNFYKVKMEDATTKQIWAVYFSLKGSSAQRAGRMKKHYARSGGKPAKKDSTKRI